jgi:predicted nucleic acid-binding protein
MTLVLDSGGLSELANHRARWAKLRVEGHWPPQVPSAVLVEALTGDHRRDFHTNQVLRFAQVRDVDETMAREAARLRTATGRAGTISAVDALVVAFAQAAPKPWVLTSDPDDLQALADCSDVRITIGRS